MIDERDDIGVAPPEDGVVALLLGRIVEASDPDLPVFGVRIKKALLGIRRCGDAKPLGLRDFVIHFVPVPVDLTTVPAELVAVCGFRIAPGEADLLLSTKGMPCTTCILLAPVTKRALPG
ncbi:hypothetical protein BCF44_13613 [Kutzneria buriramensis]|uniref:Uncharacterized protein n=2 Tax=Kutzneria buriramensis TaxID=1045776 RepID=A0A3E0G6N0_9PSEU|nr:hypothetical protein BCF44_13613 [Kutzneria buriramensis]